MLKASVGLSRKLSEKYHSSGFSLKLEGEINASLDDPQAVIDRIKEFFDLAEAALDQEVESYKSDSAIANRDRDHSELTKSHRQSGASTTPHTRTSNENQVVKSENGRLASNKQVQFLQTLARRQKLSGIRLDGFIEEILGRRCPPCELTKMEAGAIIDALNSNETGGKHSPN